MKWKDIPKLLGKGAPIVGGLLGGPAGAAVGGMVAKALGASPEPQSVAAALQSDPAAMTKIAELESNERVRLAELALEHVRVDVDVERIHAGDRDSARRREIEVKDHIPAALAMLVTVGFFGVLFFLLMHGKPSEGGDALLVMLGSLGTAWASVIAYYFGSTAAGLMKTRIIAKSDALKE